MRIFVTTFILIFGASLIVSQSMASGEVLQLSDNYFYDGEPQIHNGQVVWLGGINIFYWDGSSTQKLTDATPWEDECHSPQIHNGQVVWYTFGFPSIYGLRYWDGIDKHTIAGGYKIYTHNPRIHNKQVVWVNEYNDFIGFWDGSSQKELSYGDSNHAPQIHNGQVVWSGWDGNDFEIYLWGGSSTQNISNNSYDDDSPQIHNGQVVWSGWDGNDFEIYHWGGSSAQNISNNSYDDDSPQIHNGQVVWRGWDGNDFEIYLWNGSSVKNISNNSSDDDSPQIHNGLVVWRGWDGNDYEIYYWDGSSVKNISNNSIDDVTPQIHDGQVVWSGWDGNDDEIFYYKEEIFEVLINDRINFKPIKSTFSFIPEPVGCQPGAVGKFTFDANLTNMSEKELSYLHVEVNELTNTNLLQTDDGLIGKGKRFVVSKFDDYADGDLSTDEYVHVAFTVCLNNTKPFRLFVSVTGVAAD